VLVELVDSSVPGRDLSAEGLVLLKKTLVPIDERFHSPLETLPVVPFG
jgi:hypothetical protein